MKSINKATIGTDKDNFVSALGNAASAMVGRMASETENSRHIEDNEIELIWYGVKKGWLSIEGNKIHVQRKTKNGPVKSEYDLFTLNREYVTQFAALMVLIRDYGYDPDDCWLEHDFMDVCVFKDEKPYIYVETKVPKQKNPGKEMDSFLQKIKDYGHGIANLHDEHDRGNDALRKAKYIFKHRPKYFWLFTPKPEERYRKFKVSYSVEGFSLTPIADIPHYSS